MPRKKTTPDPEVLPPQRFALVDALEDLDDLEGDITIQGPETVLAVMAFEKHLLDLAHFIAREAIRVGEADNEAERVKAAERQVRLIAKLMGELQQVSQFGPQG